MKLSKKSLSRGLLLLLSTWAAGYFCNLQTDGFRIHEILSNMPNRERWETPHLSATERAKLLNQSFTYLGHGEQFYAFLGRDQKSVLKFFRHDYLSPRQLLRYLPLPASFKSALLSYKSRYDLSPLFDSAKLAFDELKEESGLITLHLNKSRSVYKTVTIYDKLGIAHSIDLDSTEFLLQKKAEPFCVALDKKMQQHAIESAKKQIHSLMDSLKKQYQKGILITDSSFKRNFGVIGDQALIMDVGSFIRQKQPMNREEQSIQIRKLTSRLERWLKHHYPELLETYGEDCLLKTSSNL
ncbi:MAG: hypothetical protein HYX48_05770 [Chlamydiales bacterium]|nr:hypothetical protein [Chlamydiales bacterium]